jgi:hypothetical protein
LTSERLETGKAKDTISRFHVSTTIIAQACLSGTLDILLHLDENITNDSLKDFPLAEYVAKHWVGLILAVGSGLRPMADLSRVRSSAS